MSNTYQRLHALHYDVVYGEKPYEQEAAFVCPAREPPAALLDLACGTARHALAFAARGFRVVGVDYSAELLARAATGDRRVERCGAHRGRHARARPGRRPFDAATCLFDSIGYPLTDEGIVAVLGRARAHRRRAGAWLSSTCTRRRCWRRTRRTGATLEHRVRRRSYGCRRRAGCRALIMTVEYELIELRADGPTSTSPSSSPTVVFTVPRCGSSRARWVPSVRSGPAYEDGAIGRTRSTSRRRGGLMRVGVGVSDRGRARLGGRYTFQETLLDAVSGCRRDARTSSHRSRRATSRDAGISEVEGAAATSRATLAYAGGTTSRTPDRHAARSHPTPLERTLDGRTRSISCGSRR